MRFGAHVSIAGGIENAPIRAKELGCECFQMFTRSPRGGKPPELKDKLLERFFTNCSDVGISDYYVHAPYFVNLASAQDDLREKSATLVREELERSSLLRVRYLMIHVGSAKEITREEGISNVISSLEKILGDYRGTTQLLIENMAGQGHTVGVGFDEISSILARTRNEDIGVCIDTAHMFASGYDIRTAENVDNLVDQILSVFDLDTVKLIHANDSKAEFNSNKDRHEHIGEGKIGVEGFKAIVGHPFFADMDMIVELPPKEVARDIDILKKFRDMGKS